MVAAYFLKGVPHGKATALFAQRSSERKGLAWNAGVREPTRVCSARTDRRSVDFPNQASIRFRRLQGNRRAAKGGSPAGDAVSRASRRRRRAAVDVVAGI